MESQIRQGDLEVSQCLDRGDLIFVDLYDVVKMLKRDLEGGCAECLSVDCRFSHCKSR